MGSAATCAGAPPPAKSRSTRAYSLGSAPPDKTRRSQSISTALLSERQIHHTPGFQGSATQQRLSELRESQLVEKNGSGSYALTEAGTRLLARLDGIDEWTQEWAGTIRRGAPDESVDGR